MEICKSLIASVLAGIGASLWLVALPVLALVAFPWFAPFLL